MPSLAECAVQLVRGSRHKPGLRGAATIPKIEAYATVRPTPGRLAAFRDVCGIAPSECLPLTWPYALVTPLHIQLVCSRAFPFSALGLVHIREVIRQTQRIPVDAELSFHCRIEGHRPHRRGIEFDLITEVSLGSGMPVVWRSTTTALIRTHDRASTSRERASTGTRETTAPPPGERWKIPENTGRRYARVSKNFDPIHLHTLTSRWFGFHRPIIHGMWTVARSVAALGPAASAPPIELDVRFRSPLFIPGEVVFSSHGEAESRSFAVHPRLGGRPHIEGQLRRP